MACACSHSSAAVCSVKLRRSSPGHGASRTSASWFRRTRDAGAVSIVLPPRTFVARTKEGRRYYIYADPDYCRWLPWWRRRDANLDLVNPPPLPRCLPGRCMLGHQPSVLELSPRRRSHEWRSWFSRLLILMRPVTDAQGEVPALRHRLSCACYKNPGETRDGAERVREASRRFPAPSLAAGMTSCKGRIQIDLIAFPTDLVGFAP